MKSKLDEKRHYSRYFKYLNIYEVHQCWGGPEEGGWWYDAGYTVRGIGRANSRKVGGNRRRRKKAVKRAIAICEMMNEGRRPKYSVLSDGWASYGFSDRTAPHYFPRRRPHYE